MTRAGALGALASVVGFLAFVEFTSGILQGYYTPMLTDIARHLDIHDADVNWLEGAQLMLSALVVPAFAKLGDMVGHKRMLLISTVLSLWFTQPGGSLPASMGGILGLLGSKGIGALAGLAPDIAATAETKATLRPSGPRERNRSGRRRDINMASDLS